jgi:predicted Ser/Thr protein kinase
VGNVNIETVEDLKKALKEIGYSNKAITEILKWYVTNRPPMN